MKLTVKEAMLDFRTEFLARIFNHYPEHKKMWKAEEIEKEISSVMYDLSLQYLEKAEADK